MRYCGIFDPIALGRTTMTEYFRMMKAAELVKQDEMYMAHLQAWLNAQVNSTRKQGKNYVPVYRTFDSFYKLEKDGKKAKKQDDKLKALIAKANKKDIDDQAREHA